jgi:hypothetical protein
MKRIPFLLIELAAVAGIVAFMAHESGQSDIWPRNFKYPGRREENGKKRISKIGIGKLVDLGGRLAGS